MWMLLWVSLRVGEQSLLTGQENNVTPGNWVSGPGKSTCRTRGRRDICTLTIFPSVTLVHGRGTYYSVCTSPQGSTHHWWQPPHLHSQEKIKRCMMWDFASVSLRTSRGNVNCTLTHGILEGLRLHQQVDPYWSRERLKIRNWERDLFEEEKQRTCL